MEGGGRGITTVFSGFIRVMRRLLPEVRHDGRELGGEGGAELELPRGSLEGEAQGMEHQPAHAAHRALLAVEVVAHDRMPDEVEVDAQLVPAPRVRLELHEGGLL